MATDKVLRQRAYADRLFAEKQEDLASMHPTAPLASKMWRNAKSLLSDKERGSVSPLDGRATVIPKGKGKR